MAAETVDIVVIGGGIIGCSVVFYLADLLPKSTRIAIFDRGPIAGATSGSCQGHLMVTPDNARAYRFTHESVRLWGDLADQLPASFESNPTGALYLAEDADDLPLLQTLREQFHAHGDDAEILDNRGLRQRDPGLAEDIPGGLFYAGDGVVMPMLAAGAMLRGARQRNPNVVIRPHCGVQHIEVDDGGRVMAVRTEQGEVATRTVVNSAGVWATEVAEAAGLSPPPIYPRRGDLAITGHHTTPIRTQLLEVSYLRVAHGAAQADPTRTDGDAGAHAVNMQPQSHGGCLIGSTRQFCGMQRKVNRELLHRSLMRAARYVPGLKDSPVVRTWAGLRPYSIDKLPLIGPSPRLQGYLFAAGHEGLGISLAPITGLLIAQCILGVEPIIPIEPYLPGRFES